MQNPSWRQRCHSSIPPQVLSFPLPLTSPIPISEGSCNKNLETIGGPLFFSPNPAIQHLIANYWPLREQLNISAIFAKVVLSNFGLTTNH